MNRNKDIVKEKKQPKKLQELTMKDNFMFGALLIDPENCKGFLERALQICIEHIEIDIEKSMVYNPECKGIRLDVYANDENHTHYNVEMQAVREAALGRHSRYYHSQIDMGLLERGHEYEELPDSYVIFVCDFDPFYQGKYCYTFKNICKETGREEMDDGRSTIFLNTRGKNEDEVPEELVKLLKFVKADLDTCMDDFEDDYVKQLQESMQRIKESRAMEGRYMRLELLLHDERKKAREEGKRETLVFTVLELLSEKVRFQKN